MQFVRAIVYMVLFYKLPEFLLMRQKSAPMPPEISSKKGMRRFQVRRSGIHGRGVFALTDIAAGDVVVQYKGELITWQEAELRHEAATGDPYHTFLFQVDNGMVVDGGSQGNSARWINHSCEPNCEVQEDDSLRLFIVAVQPIAAGDELFFDYSLELPGRISKAMQKAYACRCGAPTCRGTMLMLPIHKKQWEARIKQQELAQKNAEKNAIKNAPAKPKKQERAKP